jgi:hypothetical protein
VATSAEGLAVPNAMAMDDIICLEFLLCSGDGGVQPANQPAQAAASSKEDHHK